MTPTSDTPLPLDFKVLQEFLDQETECLRKCSNTGDVQLVSPAPVHPRFGSSKHLSVPIDIRNYLLSPPPPPADDSWKSRMESPPVTHEEELYQTILSSKKKVEKAKNKGCTVEGITYFIGENAKLKLKKKKKDGKNTPGIIVHLCED